MGSFHLIRRADMRKLCLVFFLTITFATGVSAQQANSAPRKAGAVKSAPAASVNIPGMPPAVAAAMNSIDAERIRTQVKFISDDLFEGRGTGQRGGDMAARYL